MGLVAGDQLASGYFEPMTSGDFNGDGRSELAAGCFSCGTGGFVRVWPGTASGLDLANYTTWSQDSAGIGDQSESGDGFGNALAAGDYGLGPEDDLAVGAFDEEINGLLEVGLAHSIFGSAQGLKGAGSQLLKEKPPVQYDLYAYSLNGEQDISH
jgi:hypothetical protein